MNSQLRLETFHELINVVAPRKFMDLKNVCRAQSKRRKLLPIGIFRFSPKILLPQKLIQKKFHFVFEKFFLGCSEKGRNSMSYEERIKRIKTSKKKWSNYEVRTTQQTKSQPTCVSFNPAGTVFATGDKSGHIKLFDVAKCHYANSADKVRDRDRDQDYPERRPLLKSWDVQGEVSNFYSDNGF